MTDVADESDLVAAFPDATLEPAAPAPGSLVADLLAKPRSLAYFLLNVGDGDTQLIVLPEDQDGNRRLVVVDIATTNKLPRLLDSLHAAGLIEPPGTAGQVRLMVASHPHQDHIGGMPQFFDTYAGTPGFVDQFWESGFFYPSPAFHNLMLRLDGRRDLRWMQPTSGTSLFLDAVRITVTGPGIGLRNRFDTYGVDVNDASITLMVEYPATKVQSEVDPADPSRINRRLVDSRTRRLLLGADAQFKSWAQATVDFPDLVQEFNSVLAKELRSAQGRDYLKADLLKVSHHGSKHGVNIELLERVAAPMMLVSSQIGGGSYGFPHLLAMEAVRESRQATAASGTARKPDWELGVHVTGGSVAETGGPLGSIAVLADESGTAPLRLYRLFDRPDQSVDLAGARRFNP